jgi:hypothetical protein
MTRDETRSSSLEDTDGILEKCLAHLDGEETHLQTILDCLREVRAGLISTDHQGLAKSLQEQETLSEKGHELATRREDLRGELAKYLGNSPRVATLGAVIDHIGAKKAAGLLTRRNRVRSLALEVNEINRDNAVLVNYSLAFVREVLRGITGSTEQGKRYSPAGAYQGAGCGVIVSVQG